MAFIPYNQFVIETPLPVEEVMEKLSRVVQPKNFWPNPFSQDRKQFEGIVSKGRFRMVRNIYYLNSFIPLIKGRFGSSDSGTRIIITMATHPFVILTFGLVFAFFGYFLFTFLMELISGMFVILGCLALAYTICTLAFKRESALDRKFLVKLFSERDSAPQLHQPDTD
jgi:hypothetical protein